MNNLLKSCGSAVRSALSGVAEARFPRDQMIQALDDSLRQGSPHCYTAAVIIFEIDRFRALEESRDGDEVEHVLRVIEERLITGPCRRDMVRRLGAGRFGVVLSPLRDITMETAADLALHLQQEIARPVVYPAGQTEVTISVGYAIDTELEVPSGSALLEAATIALLEAARNGLGTVCAFAPAMLERVALRTTLARDAGQALRSGAICAFFQPQVNVETGQVIGFEALARWEHAERGMIPPCDFLPVLEHSGLMQELGFTILRQALSALQAWDKAGHHVPTVSVNMSSHELRNPLLIDAVKMELDAFGLTPKRLIIEVLETVVASNDDDVIIQNLRALGQLGCNIDLDDFGTGQASITTIRRFNVDRLKIDRSFVERIDHDKDQQEMVAAILTMAERLKVRALAEGVETPGEMSFLNVVGCGDIQGYAVARPMPMQDVLAWMQQWSFKTAEPPNLRYVQ